jgi:ATP-dependent RNA helicase DDX55/SPB4
MHGKMKQVQREKVCEDFSSSSSGVLLSTDLVARGLDFIDIKWILQFDPPQNPDFFVHRIGRTARASKSGKSLIFLCEKEQSYLNYLELKGIQFKPKKLKLARNVFQEVSSVVLRNRENYEKAQAAFVAYVRYYKEHLLSFIFQFKDLDLGFLAQSFCLLRIPRVSEIVGKKIENFVQSELDPEDIRYSDLAREEKRQKMKREKQELKEKMFQDKKKRKMKNLKKNNQRPRSRSEKREAKRQMMIDDFDDLGKEERVVKKIRKGKMEDPEVQKFLEDNPNFKSFFRKKKH